MFKKMLIIYFIIFGVNLSATEMLTGDKRLACEAILCLSSGTRPSECSPSLSRYFGIHHKKWKDTVNARRNFLKLCPVGSVEINDNVFKDLRDNILPHLSADKCTAEYLNNHPETKCIKENCGEHHCRCIESLYRPARQLIKECEALYNHSYTYIKPKNVCGYPTKWYTEEEWTTGYANIEISKNEYLKLEKEGSNNIWFENPYSNFRKNDINKPLNKFYTKQKINRECWTNPKE